MKVGILIPEFPAQTHLFFWREMRALRALGVDVAILSTRRPADPCPHEFGQHAAPLTHYLFPPRPAALARGFERARSLSRVLPYISSLSLAARPRALGYALCALELAEHARAEGIDHIHVHSCGEAAHVVAMARLLGGPPYSLHLHGDVPVDGTDHRPKMQHAAFVSAAARAIQKQITDATGLPDARTRFMTMGVDMARFRPRVHDENCDELHMVSIGRLASCKGHRYGLEALRAAREAGARIRYTIGGSGPTRAQIEADIARLGLGSHVQLIGPLSEQGVVQLLQRADVFLLASLDGGEASPVAVMEAMASGVPAICSITGGTPDMITHELDGLLVPQADIEQLKQAMLRVAGDRALLARMGRAARARAEREFDANVLARRLLAAIRQAA